jgi:hypothetical protein
MKPILAGILTVAILAAVLILGSRRGTTTVPSEPQAAETQGEVIANPAEETVRRLLRSGEDGDVTSYLAAFADPLKARLEREVEGRGREAFAGDLKRAAAARKSHAVFAAEPDGDAAAKVAVETVYPDRNDRQTYRVERTDDGWRIVDVATIRSHQPSAKFGTPASYIAPEGVPVQAPPPRVGVTVETGDDSDSP